VLIIGVVANISHLARILGVLALLHSAALLVWLLIAFIHYGGLSFWEERLWLSFASVWFCWPVVLAHVSPQ
jgi:hypothetical protein